MKFTANQAAIVDDEGRVIPLGTPEYESLSRRSASGEIHIEAHVEMPAPTVLERRAAKYQARVDQWTHAIVRYEKRLLDARLSAEKKTKIQAKLDAAILKVQDESTAIEAEDPD